MTIAFFALLTVFFIVLLVGYAMMSAFSDMAGGLLSGVTRGAVKYKKPENDFVPYFVLVALTLASIGGLLWGIFK